MTAKEARELSTKNMNSFKESEYKIILHRIIKKVEKGEFELYIEGDISKSIESKLIQDGYTIEHGNERGSPIVKIVW